MKRHKTDYSEQDDLLFELLRSLQKKLDKSRLPVSENTNTGNFSKQKKSVTEIARRLKIQNKKLLEQLLYLKEEIKKLKADKNVFTPKFNQLIKLNRSLSDATGSCHQCWGDDPDCALCGGNGSSGWREINKRSFNKYIVPALDRKY